jgi:hypothetical protein
MTTENLITSTEGELRELAAELIAVREGECLLCYVYRMLEFGCTGFRWAGHYRDTRAPRATGLERRLGRIGGFCDCEIFMNAYQPTLRVWTPGSTIVDERGFEEVIEPEWPEQMPLCLGSGPGSTKPCLLWVRVPRW